MQDNIDQKVSEESPSSDTTEQMPDVDVVEQPVIKKWDDRDEDHDATSDILPLNSDAKNNYVLLPAATYDKILALVTKLNLVKSGEEDTLLTREDVIAQGTTINSADKTIVSGMFADRLNSNPDEWVSDVKYADMLLRTRSVGLPAKKGTISGATAVAKFTSVIGVGDVIQVPLWHSGFWVTLKPATQSELINLERAIASNEITAGRETNTLVYSNYGVIINRILVDFIVGHITDTSLKLPGDGNITDYISVHDYFPLVVGLLTSMYPSGFEYVRPCVESSVLVDADGNDVTEEMLVNSNIKVKAKCSHIATGKLDPKRLMKHNRLLITNGMREHMAKRMPQSVSITECINYRKMIHDIDDKTVEFTASNDSVIAITFYIPMLSQYIATGEAWIMKLIELGEELFTKADTNMTKNAKIDEIVSANALGIYNAFVKKIAIGDEIASDTATVTEILEMFTNDEKLFESIMDVLKEYISLSPIALPAIANYNCPNCKKDQNTKMAGTHFKELIPLNPVETFFDLSVLRVQKVRKSIY